MHLDFWGATDIGCVRARNEDNYLVDPALGLAVVADGIGGQFRGDIAGTLACRTVREHLLRTSIDLEHFRTEPTLLRRQKVEERLREAVQLANTEVFRAGLALSRGLGMGCTLDAVVVLGNVAFVAHVGDARTYLIRDGKASAVTEDHTVAQEKVRRGMMTQDQADRSAERNMLTRSVGGLPSLRLDTHILPFEPGDRLFLCSDGVTRYISAPEVAAFASPGGAEQVEALVELARHRGGVDNITGVMVLANAQASVVPTITPLQLDEMRSVRLFETCTSRELRLLSAIAVWQEARAGKLLFREGYPGTEMYSLVEGEVLITRGGHHLATLRPGDSFGEMALIDAPVRSASALATRDCRLIAIPKHRFEQVLRQDDGLNSRLSWALIQRLSEVVRLQNERLHPLGTGG